MKFGADCVEALGLCLAPRIPVSISLFKYCCKFKVQMMDVRIK